MNTDRTAALEAINADAPAEVLAPERVYVAPSPYAIRILLGLNRTGKHIYAGTVPAATIAKRRARNKVARASRRVNRGTR